ncbi:helix-turn-helix domain-containing protein [Herbiconiux solani]|uniref:helix-turn-helix domain-containing protein n=1 Tax=Herbiconiux solani TaxID=661329 RepID=UPI0008254211|nr:GAF domain-containing protein [Herbiconiux solani]
MDSELVVWLGRLRELSAVAVGGRSVDQALELVAETARELLGFDFCGVLVPDAAGTALVITGWSGLSREYVDGVNRSSPVTLGSTAPSSQAYFGGRPVAVSDIEVERGFEPWGGVAQEQGYRSMISVPLIGADRVLGTLNGYHARIHEYSDLEVERLTLLANHAAAALTSASLVEELRGANASLLEQRDLLAKSEDIHRRLLRVSLESGGLDGVVRTLADLIGRAVRLEDPRGETLAEAGGAGSTARRHDAAQAPGHDGAHDPAHDRAHDGEIVEVPVRLGAEEVGVLRVDDPSGAGLDALDARAVDHASVVIALEVLRIRAALETEYRIQGEVLTDVLLFGVTEQASRRAAALGHDLAGLRVATVASVPGLGGALGLGAADTRRTLAALSAVSALTLPGTSTARPLVAALQGMIVALWPAPRDSDRGASGADAVGEVSEAAGPLVLRALHTAFPGEKVLVAASGAHHRPLPEAFRIARGALTLARATGRADEVITPAGLGLVGVLLQTDQPETLLEFARERLGPLMDYDRARGTDLVETLRRHLDDGLDRAATAAALRLHPNTVNQRLRRIEALTGAELRRPADVVSFASALAVWDVARSLTATLA